MTKIQVFKDSYKYKAYIEETTCKKNVFLMEIENSKGCNDKCNVMYITLRKHSNIIIVATELFY